jgi:hypothetical protein
MNLSPYDCTVISPSGRSYKGFRDWFADDKAAAIESLAILSEQGYKVASVEVAAGKVTVTLCN